MKESKLVLPGYLKALVVLLLIIIIVFIVIMGRGILIPLFLGGLIGILLTPAAEFLEENKIPRIISTLIAVITGLMAIVGILAFVVMQVAVFSRDLENVGERLNNYLIQIDSFFFSWGLETELVRGLDQDYLIGLIQSNSSSLGDFLFSTIGSLAGVVLVPVFTFFLILYRDHMTSFIANLYHHHNNAYIRREIKGIRRVVQQYIIGILKVMAILAVLNTAVLFGLGIEHAVFFGLFAALLNIIPYLGPFLGAVLPTIFAFLTKDSLFYPISVVIAFQIIQLIESNFLTPKIVGNNVNLNAFVTFLGLLIGAAIWGIIGMIIIIPILAVLRKIFEYSKATRPFALLLGEEIIENSTDEIDNVI
jgi:predicted PurR-regulated permease PerM